MKLATQVGAPYDAAAVARDVRTLWSIGRFRDVKVETVEDEKGADVIFRVTPEPQFPLREIRMRPHAFGIEMSMPPGSLITQPRAADLALMATRQLVQRGYAKAKASASLVPAPGGKADVVLDIEPGQALKLKALGDTSLRPPRWYSPAAVEGHAARLRSKWIADGYFDAKVVTTEKLEAKRADVFFRVEPGKFYHPLPMRTLCGCLFAERRAAERAGIMDFDATVNEAGEWEVQRGKPYTVGRIRFLGNRQFGDAIIRNHFLLDEGAPLDSWRLRQSIVRLNRAAIFEPVDEHAVRITPNERAGTADITVQLTERKRGRWSFSGPLPLSASVNMRIPGAPSFLVGFNALAYSSLLKLAYNRRFFPMISLERPYTPGEGWKSGFAIAPQMGPQWMVLHYVGAQLEGRLGPWLAGTRVPDLTVAMPRPGGDTAAILCEAPRPRLRPLRMAAGMALGFVRTLTM